MRHVVIMVLAMFLHQPLFAAGKNAKRRTSNKSAKKGSTEKPELVAVKVHKSLGHLTNKRVIKVISNNLDDVKRCYMTIRMLHPDASGRLEYRIEVSQYGDVEKVRVRPHTLPSNLEVCVTDHLKTWQFPKSKSGKDGKTRYTITFNPGD